jgi:hypothetical protein
MCQKCETDASYIIAQLSLMHYLDGNRKTWVNTDKKTAQHPTMH